MTVTGTVAPVPVVSIAGVDIASGPDPDGDWPDLMALDGVTVKWGRARVLEQPDPAMATVRLFDPSGSWAAAVDVVGKPVSLRWTVAATTRVFFTGRVAAVEVQRHKVRRPDGNITRGALVTLSCTSLLVDLGNRASGFPRQTIAARRAGILADSAGPVSAIVPSEYWDWDSALVFATAENTTALTELRRLFDASGAARFTYDPHTRVVSVVERRVFSDPLTLAVLSRDDSRVGVFISAPGGWIDGGAVSGSDTAGKDLESRLTRVQVGYYTLNEAGDGLEQATLTVPVPGADESLTGVRAVSVDTGLTTLSGVGSDALATTAGQQLASLAANEAAGWTLQPIRWDTARTGGGFETLEQAVTLLSGTELPGVHFLQRTSLPDLGICPVFGVMGGTISYRDRAWSVEWQPAPIKTTPPGAAALSWEDLPPSLVWDRNSPDGLHDSVTYEDMAFVADSAIHDRSA